MKDLLALLMDPSFDRADLVRVPDGFGDRIRERCEEMGLSTYRLGALAGVPRVQAARWLLLGRGRGQRIPRGRYELLCALLGIAPDGTLQAAPVRPRPKPAPPVERPQSTSAPKPAPAPAPAPAPVVVRATLVTPGDASPMPTPEQRHAAAKLKADAARVRLDAAERDYRAAQQAENAARAEMMRERSRERNRRLGEVA